MRNVNINLRVSFTENGTSGFTLKDMTGINSTGFMTAEAGPSLQYYRTTDVIFLDIVSYNQLDDNKLTGFKYIIESDADYTKYKLDYISKIDGWFTVDHLVLPTLNYMLNFIKPTGDDTEITDTFYDGAYLVYDSDLNKYVELNIVSGVYTSTDVDLEYIKNHLDNTNLLGIEEQLFLIGHLEKCYESMIKYILYNNLFDSCLYKDPDISALYRNRDIVWMALELIRRLINNCKFFEAQRLLERISTCNTFCTNLINKLSNAKSSTIRSCNCLY